MPETKHHYEDSVYQAVYAIPAGYVTSYSAIARSIGLPRYARWVARVLSQNTDPKLPWHRVIRADRKIPFTVGTTHYQQQHQRLLNEGIVIHNNRISAHQMMSDAGIKIADLDRLLWKMD